MCVSECIVWSQNHIEIFLKDGSAIQNLQHYSPHNNSSLPTYGWVGDFDNFEATKAQTMVDIQCFGYGNWMKDNVCYDILIF